MPRQKDLKRVVRARMEKTGESYTAARLQVTRKTPRLPDYEALSGMKNAAVKEKTGRDWSEWVALLDRGGWSEKPHRDIAKHVHSLGVPGWWSQSVTVGYERIKGRRAIGQRADGKYEASKSRTFAVPLATLYEAFANARRRKRWMAATPAVKSASPGKRMRLDMGDGTSVEVYFMAKGAAKSSVAVAHSKLTDRAAVEARKAWWSERLDALAELLG